MMLFAIEWKYIIIAQIVSEVSEVEFLFYLIEGICHGVNSVLFYKCYKKLTDMGLAIYVNEVTWRIFQLT